MDADLNRFPYQAQHDRHVDVVPIEHRKKRFISAKLENTAHKLDAVVAGQDLHKPFDHCQSGRATT